MLHCVPLSSKAIGALGPLPGFDSYGVGVGTALSHAPGDCSSLTIDARPYL